MKQFELYQSIYTKKAALAGGFMRANTGYLRRRIRKAPRPITPKATVVGSGTPEKEKDLILTGFGVVKMLLFESVPPSNATVKSADCPFAVAAE